MSDHLHPSSEPSRARLAPWSAIALWLAILFGLNLTVNPVVSGCTFLGLAILAWVSGHRRLLTMSLIVGLGMLLVVPGVSFIDGSYAFTYAEGTDWLPDATIGGVTIAAASLARVPALVLSVVVLLQVDDDLLIAGIGRISSRSAMLGGLTARIRPSLSREVLAMRDELSANGLRFDSRAPFSARIRAAFALWEAIVTNAFDRAFATAAALQSRGFGSPNPTRGELQIGTGKRQSAANAELSMIVGSLSLIGLGLIVIGRAVGAVEPPAISLFSGVNEPLTAVVLGIGIIYAAATLLPALAIARYRRLDTMATGGISGLAVDNSAHCETSSRRSLGFTMRDVLVTYPSSQGASLQIDELTVSAGECIVLAGYSGSGKSTLLDVITGVAQEVGGATVTGDINFDDDDVVIACVFQDPERQSLATTVQEEIAFALRQAGLPLPVIEQRVITALQSLALEQFANRSCATLSGGELQRVMLAAAIAQEPDVLLLDEPTSQLDAQNEQLFWESVQQLRSQHGTTVLISEHRLRFVLSVADRVVALHDGRIIHDCSSDVAGAVMPQLVASPYSRLTNSFDREKSWRFYAPNITVRLPTVDQHALLRCADLSLRAGSVVTLEGSNGVGKSTLLRAIRGLHPLQGTLLVDGRRISSLQDGLGLISLVTQHAGPALYAASSAKQLAASWRCNRSSDSSRIILAALDSAGLLHCADRHPADMSVGERQRLAVLAGTCDSVPVWLLDEPTRGMDSVARRWCAERLVLHSRRGGVVLIATHDSELAAAIATHRLVLSRMATAQLVPVAPRPSSSLLTSIPGIEEETSR